MTHQCIIKDIDKRRHSSIYKFKLAYLSRVKSFKNYLFRKGGDGWNVPACIIAALLSEPVTNVYIGLLPYISGWKSLWSEYGFFDAGDINSLEALRNVLRESVLEPPPVILLHGLATTPDVWISWAKILKEARDAKKIGHVIALQLPNDMHDRMNLVYQAVDDVATIYKEASLEGVVDLVGHSQGGYAAHLAAFERILEAEKEFSLDRCHNPNIIKQRNKKVRKLVSLGGAKRIFSEDDLSEAEAFSSPFLGDHENIFDIIGVEDVLCPHHSHLEHKQVYVVEHGHLAMIVCPTVCQLVIDILSEKKF